MRNTYQIIILGPGGVGKTKGTNTLMNILQTLGFQTSEVKPWTEAMVTTSSYVIHNFTVPPSYFSEFNDPLKIVIYDMGGQFKYKEMWRLHAEDTDAIIAVVDMTRMTTLKQIPLMLPRGIMAGIPVRLIVNKADLYTDFSSKIETIVHNIEAIIQQAKASGTVDYTVRYKGEEKFEFNSNVYRYGDLIQVNRPLERNEHGQVGIRMGDMEAIVAAAFKHAMPNLTEHNSYLFGREFTLQVFDAIMHHSGKEGTLLSDDLIESAHNEAPPFISWGDDPDVIIPIAELTVSVVRDAVSSMLIDDQGLWDMVNKLRQQGYNINVDDENSWALTSAMLFDDNPNVNYKPMHKAVLPPFFIKKMVQYNHEKQAAEDEFFV